LAATPTVSRGVHDSQAEPPNALLLSAVHPVAPYTHTVWQGHAPLPAGWCPLSPKPPSSFTENAPFSCCNLNDARLPIHDGAGADVLVLVQGKHCQRWC
jgi:hypothetical protein